MTMGAQPRQHVALVDYYRKQMRQADREGRKGSLKSLAIIVLTAAAIIAVNYAPEPVRKLIAPNDWVPDIIGGILAIALIYALILLPTMRREAAQAENHYDDNGKRLLNAYGLDPEQDIISITRLGGGAETPSASPKDILQGRNGDYVVILNQKPGAAYMGADKDISADSIIKTSQGLALIRSMRIATINGITVASMSQGSDFDAGAPIPVFAATQGR